MRKLPTIKRKGSGNENLWSPILLPHSHALLRRKPTKKRKSAVEKVISGELKLTATVDVLDLAGLPPNFVQKEPKPAPLSTPPIHQSVRRKPRLSILGEKVGDAHIANTVHRLSELKDETL